MIDLKLLKDNPEVVREGLKKRGLEASLDPLITLDKQRRELIAVVDANRQKLKKESDTFAEERKGKAGPPPEALKRLSERIKQWEGQLRQIEEQIEKDLTNLPNIPHESVPVGDASKNRVERTIGKPASFSFKPKTHVELAGGLGLIDFSRATKIAGSNFALYIGVGAQLERALIQWMLEVQTKEHGYTEVSPPFLVNRISMFGTGQLPRFEEDMYRLKDDDLFLVPTAEVPVTNIHRDEILEEKQLPIRYTAYTPCFRREAGSYGKDTRGLVRVHQFDKVELVQFTKPEDSYAALETLVGHAETILKRLGLHYRVVSLASEDLSFASAKCYDLEAWAPGLERFLEVSSCSNFEAFQARRAKIRFRRSGKKIEPVHTLNGSGVALARTVVCLLETHQKVDGHVTVPEVLRPYLDGRSVL